MTLRSLKNLKPEVHNEDKIIRAFMNSSYYKDEDYQINHTTKERLEMFVKSPAGMYCKFTKPCQLHELYKKFILLKNGLPLTTR